jgi:heat shock protein HtpX
LRELSARAGLPATPVPHYVPSAVVNAFATGSKQHASIALTDGLLRNLSSRELAGVLAHEVAHIANEDLRVMGLADSVSRLTSLLALMGQIAILLSLPALLVGAAEVNWPGLLLLAASPQLALLAQLGLSRVREFDADRLAAELTGDPQGWRPRWRKSSGSAAPGAPGCGRDGAIPNPPGCARIRQRKNASHAC